MGEVLGDDRVAWGPINHVSPGAGMFVMVRNSFYGNGTLQMPIVVR